MNNRLVKQILGAGALAVGAALFAGFFGDLLHQTPTLDKPAYMVKKSDGDDAGDSADAKPAGPEPVEALLAAADIDAGAKVVKKKCGACHTVEDGGKHKTGPNLWAVVGREKGTADGFDKYSSAMQDFGGDWSYAELNNFLNKPKAYISGTKMGFAGLKKTSDRANVIAYLRTLSADPVPLP